MSAQRGRARCTDDRSEHRGDALEPLTTRGRGCPSGGPPPPRWGISMFRNSRSFRAVMSALARAGHAHAAAECRISDNTHHAAALCRLQRTISRILRTFNPPPYTTPPF